MGWNGVEWNGMEWNGMEWNGMEYIVSSIFFLLLSTGESNTGDKLTLLVLDALQKTAGNQAIESAFATESWDGMYDICYITFAK